MAKKAKSEAPDDILTETAKAIGKAAGKVAALAGVAPPAEAPKRVKPQKLQPKNKSRLPRREKKAQRKAAAVK